MESIHIGFCNRAAITKKKKKSERESKIKEKRKRKKNISMTLDATDRGKQFGCRIL